jgi:hypothetical protein
MPVLHAVACMSAAESFGHRHELFGAIEICDDNADRLRQELALVPEVIRKKTRSDGSRSNSQA